MKILVTGGNGLVGSHFIENYPNALGNTVLSPNREQLDITMLDSVENFFKLHNPDVVIHFAGFTDVSKAEDERDNKGGACWTTNVGGTSNLVKAAGKKSAFFIFISTDNVFSGNKQNPGPYYEDFPIEENSNLLSWYGWTKAEAENIVKTTLANFVILRISNPIRARYDLKLDYARKIINLFDQDKLYPMFEDQYLTLTYINEVTEILKIILEKWLTGIFHVSSKNLFTPYKLANFLIEKARGKKQAVRPISIEDFLKINPSRYPHYGGLKVDRTEKLLDLKLNTWEETLTAIVKQWSV